MVFPLKKCVLLKRERRGEVEVVRRRRRRRSNKRVSRVSREREKKVLEFKFVVRFYCIVTRPPSTPHPIPKSLFEERESLVPLLIKSGSTQLKQISSAYNCRVVSLTPLTNPL